MHRERRFVIIGGDERFAAITEALDKDGCPVKGLFLEKSSLRPELNCADWQDALAHADVVIFPLPMLEPGKGRINAPLGENSPELEDILDCLNPEAALFGGMVNMQTRQTLIEKHFTISDYYLRDEMTILNTIPTAEGALALAIDKTKHTIFDSVCIITGFGRVAKTLARLLKACGADVRIAARKSCAIAEITSLGCTAIEFDALRDCLADADIIFNTVPALVIGRPELSAIKKDCLIIDLASKPGGVDFSAARQKNIQTIHALSLPGKCAPESAGMYILTTVNNILKAR
jgi:dipicolinate synthase subunit A